ncbi:MAG: glycosyltransferase [Deltaproteobacteria bacterium]|nr:glycosyltransferase [Deltaproteobacteria bacterium]
MHARHIVRRALLHPIPVFRKTSLSVVVPCYNEARTLESCIRRLLDIQDEDLSLEIILVDDKSEDASLTIADSLAAERPEIVVLRHERNRGKGAALRTGFARARCEIVAIQDADLEYNPAELRKLINPILRGDADVVFGSRFLTAEEHRVLFFWHALGNSFLTLLSNMFTDLNLTDMETCYKVMRREILSRIELEEDRFGIEPELTAKLAHLRPKIFEVGISYHGRTYSDGKKIGWKDGFRALYCVLKYNAHKAPTPIQLLIYLFIGTTSALCNLAFFLLFLHLRMELMTAAVTAYFIAAAFNYLQCIAFLFRHKARWSGPKEVLMYILVVVLSAGIDYLFTLWLLLFPGVRPWLAKSIASFLVLMVNFLGRKYLVFYEPPAKPWER